MYIHIFIDEYLYIYAYIHTYDRNLCQDTCFLSGSYKQKFTNQKSKISGQYEAFEGCKNKHDYT